MKKSSILLAALAVVAVSCEKPDENPDQGNNEPKVVAVESVNLDASLSTGLTLEVEGTYNLAEKVTVLPADATDKTVTYSSSVETVATVSDAGLITAVAEGTAVITVSAGEKTATLNVTVNPVPPVTITSVAFKSDAPKTFETNLPVDLLQYLEVTPAEHEDAVTFSSSAEAVATVSTEGVLTVKGVGEAKITATVASDNTKKAELDITVAKLEYARYIDRDGKPREYLMTMTCSQDPLGKGNMINGRNNSLTAMFDGKAILKRTKPSGSTTYDDDEAESNGTAFCLIVPGKNNAGVDLSFSNISDATEKANAINNHEISFVIDLKEAKTINYFRISNISDHEDDNTVRFKKFNKISGSNDGVTFTDIATDFNFESYQTIVTGKVSETSSKNTYQKETANIKFTDTPATYRYLKFMTRGKECFGAAPKGSGTSAQIEEFYLGYDPTLGNE